ncbi:unnamed protein product [Phaedon cochleariae]|uniref:G-protein coupled receptors family 1 profile domain-containing protein n=1 Tax=Phaedon cochleariae TaxID=80249 RepID=A0A9P0DLC8_PHACE|nr:unnamed protein product [Phaedon cochleariae]
MESNYHWLITIGLVTSSVIAVTANFFLLIVFCRSRGLRTVPNRFVINLLVTNLLSSVLLIPLLLVDQEIEALVPAASSNTRPLTQFENLIIEEDISSGPTENTIEIIETSDFVSPEISPHLNGTNLLCYFAQSTTSFVCTASIFSILLIGINQYFGVIHSLRYHVYITHCKSTVLIGISWFVALFCAILSSLTYSDSSVWHFCKNHVQPSETVRILNTVYAFGYFFLVILAPFLAICIIYVCIYTAAHQNSERMRRSASAPLNPYADDIQVANKKHARDALPKVHSAPNFSVMEQDEASRDIETFRNKVKRTSSDRQTYGFINNLRHKISNASVFKFREETRAAKISVLVIFLVLVCYVPYGITLVLCSKCIEVHTSQIFNYLSLILLVFSNIISPFLFGYRNKRVKREICRIFGLVPKCKQNLDGVERPRKASVVNTACEDHICEEHCENCSQPFIESNNSVIPEVIVTCKPENERKSILKRVCDTSSWVNYKKCNFIVVPDSCISGEARGSFSSASTQISTEE